MNALIQIETGDRQLLAKVAAAMADAVRRSGDWVVCRLGCTQCCIGPFTITQLDALRLERGMKELAASDPARAAAVRARAAEYIATMGEDEDAMDEVACPALDPETGACDLYETRPVTCRSFGPATRMGDDRLAACELCYVGVSDDEIERCAVEVDPESLEARLVMELDGAGITGSTIVARVLATA